MPKKAVVKKMDVAVEALSPAEGVFGEANGTGEEAPLFINAEVSQLASVAVLEEQECTSGTAFISPEFYGEGPATSLSTDFLLISAPQAGSLLPSILSEGALPADLGFSLMPPTDNTSAELFKDAPFLGESSSLVMVGKEGGTFPVSMATSNVNFSGGMANVSTDGGVDTVNLEDDEAVTRGDLKGLLKNMLSDFWSDVASQRRDDLSLRICEHARLMKEVGTLVEDKLLLSTCSGG